MFLSRNKNNNVYPCQPQFNISLIRTGRPPAKSSEKFNTYIWSDIQYNEQRIQLYNLVQLYSLRKHAYSNIYIIKHAYSNI